MTCWSTRSGIVSRSAHRWSRLAAPRPEPLRPVPVPTSQTRLTDMENESAPTERCRPGGVRSRTLHLRRYRRGSGGWRPHATSRVPATAARGWRLRLREVPSPEPAVHLRRGRWRSRSRFGPGRGALRPRQGRSRRLHLMRQLWAVGTFLHGFAVIDTRHPGARALPLPPRRKVVVRQSRREYTEKPLTWADYQDDRPCRLAHHSDQDEVIGSARCP